jgi:glycosyltransferase involved in cell wall biosynthesis
MISTYPPRKCGIATFARDLATALRALPSPSPVQVAAINGSGESYDYPPEVNAQLDETDPGSYVAAAEWFNRAPGVDVVSVQHDFGKFGVWRDGFEADYLLPMLAALRKPVVVTLHSVPQTPNALMQRTMQAASRHADALVVMARAARAILRDAYQFDDAAIARVVQLPHGVPMAASLLRMAPIARRAIGVSGGPVLSTFGLLSDGKGIETAIRALPDLVERYPDLLYLVVGQTHPEVRKREGERYREGLVELCRALGVARHVRFVDRYLTEEEIFNHLAASDVYVTPSRADDQITSGTLAFALAAGKAIVSTPYRYARELLADDRGVLTDFDDPNALAHAVGALLDDPGRRHRIEGQAARHGQGMTWPIVAARYQLLFHIASGKAMASPSNTIAGRQPLLRAVAPAGASGGI